MANTNKAKSCASCSYKVCLARISRDGYACEDYKRKPKYVKVKSYGWIGAGTGRFLTDTEKMPNRFPCTILIESKYLKGDK